MPVIGVKSVPGCLVTIAPSLTGVPVAFLPLPSPHFETGPPVLALEPPALPPLAASRRVRPVARARRVAARRPRAEFTIVVNIAPPSSSPLGGHLPAGGLARGRHAERCRACCQRE